LEWIFKRLTDADFLIMAKDKYHTEVREALESDGWMITHDPFLVSYGVSNVEVDLGAEKLIGAEKEGRKIAVEIKSFLERSKVYAFHQAFGQYMIYQMALDYNAMTDRKLFLAVSLDVYNAFLIKQQMVEDAVEKHGLNLIIVNMKTKQIVKWIKK